MADSKVDLELALTGDAEAKLKKIISSLSDLESKGGKALKSFGSNADKAFAIFKGGAAVAASIYSIKEALDLTLEAESIRAVGTQFDMLSKGAGIAGESLKAGLAGAADGLIDDTDLIKIANRAIVEMGSSAESLPPVMELARKATSVFGGELANNFEAISHAIASGQTKALKNFGIIIDSEKAYQKMADSLGVASNELSEAGKQQAILNAVLEQGNTKFANVDVNLKQATDTYQRLKVTMGQLAEASILAFEKVAGPAVKGVLTGLANAASDLKDNLTANLGEGAEQSAAKMKILSRQIDEGTKALEYMKSVVGTSADLSPGSTAAQIGTLSKNLEQYRFEYSLLQEEQRKASTLAREDAAVKQNLVDKEAALIKIREEGAKVADRLKGEDPQAKYEKDLAALSAFLEKKKGLTDADRQLKDQLELERDAKVDAKAQKEIDDLRLKNEALLALDQEKNAAEIAANDEKIAELKKKQDQHGAAYLQDEKKISDKKIQIMIAQANLVSSILGNMATTAKAFGAEGFAVYQALAKAQALVNAYSSAVGAYNSAVAVPVIGPALAPIAAAAALAAGLANVAQINATHLATGIDSVPRGYERDNFPALLQTGERVVPRETNTDLKSFLEGNGPMLQVLQEIRGLLARQPGAIVNIDGREVFNSMRSQMQSGRSF